MVNDTILYIIITEIKLHTSHIRGPLDTFYIIEHSGSNLSTLFSIVFQSILCNASLVTNWFYVHLNENKKVYFAFFGIF